MGRDGAEPTVSFRVWVKSQSREYAQPQKKRGWCKEEEWEPELLWPRLALPFEPIYSSG